MKIGSMLAMVLRSKFIVVLLFLCFKSQAQIQVNLTAKPPFTPYLSDYINPERLSDISLTLFNQTNAEQKLKFKVSIKNTSRGINIALKETTIPLNPFLMEPNEFKIVTLEDITGLYGNISQSDFDISGVNIETLILDGTLPDGNYEICVEAFDFNKPGYSTPISSGSSQGCFNFQISYIDPPTDIRLNNILLQYTFGGNVPNLNVNFSAGQNHNIVFTPSQYISGSNYEYTLKIFDESTINPRNQNEQNILEALETIQSLVEKTSNSAFFTIEPGDIQLDPNKNYYFVIKVEDGNQKAVFKNKGYSAIKAFQFKDITPVQVPAPEFKYLNCGESRIAMLNKVYWNNNFPADLDPFVLENISSRIRIVRVHHLVNVTNVFAYHSGTVLLDTTIHYSSLEQLKSIDLGERFGNLSENSGLKWAIGVENSINRTAPYTSHVSIQNNGRDFCEINYITASQQDSIDLSTSLLVSYPANGDMIPFQYPPVVVSARNLSASDKIILTQFDGELEIVESNKYLKRSTDVGINNELNSFSVDTVLGKVNGLLNDAAVLQLQGEDEAANDKIESAKGLLLSSEYSASKQIIYALNTNEIVLGNSAKGKLALLNSMINYRANADLMGLDANYGELNVYKLLYLNGVKRNLNWTGRIGIYSTNSTANGGMDLRNFEQGFVNHSFTNAQLQIPMIQSNLKSFSGSFNVGMGKPTITRNYSGQKLSTGNVLIRFVPSPRPIKLFPTLENNNAWYEFDLATVGQQWNIEISRDKDFLVLDTVISKTIAKQYNLRTEQNKVIEDLYTEVSQNIVLNKQGKFYYRITWSNPIIPNTVNTDLVNYLKSLGRLLEANGLLGEQNNEITNSADLFFTRRNYEYSNIDSFEIGSNSENTGQDILAKFELSYPLPNDTIPFMYPPVVVVNERLTPNDKAILTQFLGDLEPAESRKYIERSSDPNINNELRRDLPDTILGKINSLLNAAADAELAGNNEQADVFISQARQLLLNNELSTSVQVVGGAGTKHIAIGNSSKAKLAIAKSIINFQASNDFMATNNQLQLPNIDQILYITPYKHNIRWMGKIGAYNVHPEVNGGIGLSRFKEGFLLQNFSSAEMETPMLKNNFKTFTATFNVAMKAPIITNNLNGKTLTGPLVSVKFIPSSKPQKLFPSELELNAYWRDFEVQSVGQQWNIELSKYADFRELDTTISQLIAKEYNIRTEQQKLLEDLYTEKTILLNIRSAGKYYYRITWSNPVLPESASAANKAYFSQLQQLLEAKEIMGGASDFDSIFLKRRNYAFSSVDSFVYNPDPMAATAAKPAFELIYPLANDTIPFMYPPVVIKNNNYDAKYSFALSQFNSTLEPFENYNYFLSNINDENCNLLLHQSLDSQMLNLQNKVNTIAREQFFGTDNNVVPDFLEDIQQIEKRKSQKTVVSGASPYLVLGNNAKGKINLGQKVLAAHGNFQSLGANNNDLSKPSAANLLYITPYKSIYWTSNIAYYTSLGVPFMDVPEYENLFVVKKLNSNSPISNDNKQALYNESGNFNVGMKKPVLVKRFNGSQVANNRIVLHYLPSIAPRKLFPETDGNAVWQDFDTLQVAQQYNIEVSRNRNFSELNYVKSFVFIKEYQVPADESKIMDDFYRSTQTQIDSLRPGKYYYRITWSNPSLLNLQNPVHIKYREYQTALLNSAHQQGEISNNNDSVNAFVRRNYILSDIDSFVAVDSGFRNDTPICGLRCNYVLQNGENVVANPAVSVGDVLKVGNFDMLVKTIVNNGNQYSGTGSIRTKLFAAPVAVAFENIGLNSAKRMVSGAIKAQQKPANVLSGFGISNTLTGSDLYEKLTKLYTDNVDSVEGIKNMEKVNSIYNLINSPLSLVVESLNGADITLPFGLSKEVDNFPYTIALTDIQFGPIAANFNVVSMLNFPIAGEEVKLMFGATNLCLTPGGLGDLANGGALELLGDFNVPFENKYDIKFLGRKLENNGTTSGTGTQVIWDCKGFKQIDLKVSVKLSSSIAVAAVDNRAIPNSRVTATGFVSVNSLNNFLIGLDFNYPFQFKNVPDFTFTNQQATLDFSDLSNPENMVFPEGFLGPKGTDWKGVYIKNVGIALPVYLVQPGNGNQLGFNAENLILDPTGISANIQVQNILNLNDGRLGGWKYGIRKVQLQIIQNMPQSLSIEGEIQIPGLSSALNYNGFFPTVDSPSRKLIFAINPTQEIEIPALIGKLNLNSSSKIELLGNYNDISSMHIQTNLNGTIQLGAKDFAGFKELKFGTLPFEGLKIRTSLSNLDSFSLVLEKLNGVSISQVSNVGNTAPNTFSENGQLAGGFPINIQNFRFDMFVGKCLIDIQPNEDIRVGVKFKVLLNLIDVGGNALAGNLNLGIYGTPVFENNHWNFYPAGINLDTIMVNLKLNGACTISGGIAFISNDPVFGNGVAGFVYADFAGMFGAGVTGMFGTVNSMRYWMFGAKAKFPPIPIDFSANVLYANSISGELWYKMRRAGGSAADAAAGFQIGKSPSGASFMPSSSEMFGLALGLGLTGPPGSPLFGEVLLGASINANGGLSTLFVEGNLWMTSEDKTKAEVFVRGKTNIDVAKQKFTGSLEALVNVGEGAVRGINVSKVGAETYYSAGVVDLSIEPGNWFIHMGNPYINRPMGFGFYTKEEVLFQSTAYLMMGNTLPKQKPPIPITIKKKLEDAGMYIDNKIETGKATEFQILAGVGISIPPKSIEIGAFKADISIEAAIDGKLAKGEFNCAKRNGIGGMYATATAYSIVDASVGLNVDAPFYKGFITIAELNAGAILNSGFVNPIVLNGELALNYSVLGGLISGNTKLNFTYAEDEDCQPKIPQKAVSFGQIIAATTPFNGDTVSVGIEPQIDVNFSLHSEGVKYMLPKGTIINGKALTAASERKIRTLINYVKLVDVTSGKNKKITQKYSSDYLTLMVHIDSFLLLNHKHKLEAKFTMQTYNYSTKIWENIMRGPQKPWDTIMVLNFVTEKFAQISEANIAYTTPFHRENYFKVGDFVSPNGTSIKGMVKFKQANIANTFFTNQTPLINGELSPYVGYYKYYALLSVAGKPNDTIRMPIVINSDNVTFTLPNNLNATHLYSVCLISEFVPGKKMPAQFYNSDINANISFSGTNSNTGNLANTANTAGDLPNTTRQRNNQLEGTRTTQYNKELQGVNLRTVQTAGTFAERRKIMYSWVFRKSKYNKTVDKLAQLNRSNTIVSLTGLKEDTILLNTQEPFEEYELFGYKNSDGVLIKPPIFSLNTKIENANKNTWITKFYEDSIYDYILALRNQTTPLRGGTPMSRFDSTKYAALIHNEHIKPPLDENFPIGFDFRIFPNSLAQYEYAQLRYNLNLGFLDLAPNILPEYQNISDNGQLHQAITRDFPNLAIGTTSSSSSTSPAPTVTLGAQLMLKYVPVYRAKLYDFAQLKSLVTYFDNNPSRLANLSYSNRTKHQVAKMLDWRAPSLNDEFYVYFTGIGNVVLKTFVIKRNAFDASMYQNASSWAGMNTNTTYSSYQYYP